MTFDFDYWANLYKEDPEKFDEERLEVLKKAANGNDRIMAMVNGWDMRLSRVKNPQSRQALLERLFYEQFSKLNEALNDFKNNR